MRKNIIDNLMSDLSVLLILSRRYTNHCIRVTMVIMVTVLKEKGFSNNFASILQRYSKYVSKIFASTPDIKTLIDSGNRYSKKRRDEDFCEMSTALHEVTLKAQVETKRMSKENRVTITKSKTRTHRKTEN